MAIGEVCGHLIWHYVQRAWGGVLRSKPTTPLQRVGFGRLRRPAPNLLRVSFNPIVFFNVVLSA